MMPFAYCHKNIWISCQITETKPKNSYTPKQNALTKAKENEHLTEHSTVILTETYKYFSLSRMLATGSEQLNNIAHCQDAVAKSLAYCQGAVAQSYIIHFRVSDKNSVLTNYVRHEKNALGSSEQAIIHETFLAEVSQNANICRIQIAYITEPKRSALLQFSHKKSPMSYRLRKIAPKKRFA